MDRDVGAAVAVVLALWVTIQHPGLGPRSVRWAVIVFGLGQLVARISVPLLVPIVQLPHGAQLVLLVVVFPALFAVVLSSLWLVRAVFAGIGDPRGGHPVRGSSRHASTYRATSHSARGR